MSIASPSPYGPQGQFSYPSMMSPAGPSHVVGGYPMTPSYSGVPVPLGAQYSPQTPVAGFTPGGYYTPVQYGEAPFASGGSRYRETTTPTRPAWDSMGSPLRGASRSGTIQHGLQHGHRQNAVRGPSRQPLNGNMVQHNVVDVNRIRQGLDVRTTVRASR